RNAAARRGDGRAYDRLALGAVEIGELAGRAERGQPVHPGLDEIIDQASEHVVKHAAERIDRRHQGGKDAVEIAHAVACACSGEVDTGSPTRTCATQGIYGN